MKRREITGNGGSERMEEVSVRRGRECGGSERVERERECRERERGTSDSVDQRSEEEAP